ncbi:MAG: MFS transporter [Labrys sp. (in: a-proteobacteria)]
MRRDITLAILLLGVTQVIGYGALYYAFAVLAPEITRSAGWSSAWTYGAFSIGLFASGLVAPFSGRLIDRHGAPTMMALGSGLAGIAVTGLALSNTLPTFILAMVAVEVVSTLVLYDAAFTLLTQIAGKQARSAITRLTLIAGFASTIFWPLTVYLTGFMTWREVYLLYAALCIVVCMPIHWSMRRMIHRAAAREIGSELSAATAASPLPPALARRAFWLIAVFFATGGFVVSVLSVHMLAILQSLGYAAGVATLIGMIQGPSQVAARAVEFVFARRLPPRSTAIVSAALIPLGLGMLAFAALGPVAGVLFALSYGAGLGLNSIVRGTLPLSVFGAAGYGAMMGRLSAPGLVVKSAAPLAFALIEQHAGLTTALLVLGLVALVSLVAVILVPRVAADHAA